jgi:LuxR family maltose regulon positive regulatory protein
VFLLETSLLDRLSGELCDAVTGRAGGQAMLEAVERANLLLVPLDDVRGWWRYHHLFADLLRARLQQEQPARFTELHRSAAAWYESTRTDEAVRLRGPPEMSIRKPDHEQHADELPLGEGATVERWLATLPDQIIQARPRCCWRRWSRPRGWTKSRQSRALDAAERAYADVGQGRRRHLSAEHRRPRTSWGITPLRAFLADARRHRRDDRVRLAGAGRFGGSQSI